MNLSDLHQLLNEERKAMFFDGEDPDLGEPSIEDVVREVETAMRMPRLNRNDDDDEDLAAAASPERGHLAARAWGP